MNHPPSRAATLICAGFGLLVTLGAMLCASDGLKFLQNWLAGWVLLPFAVLFLVGCYARSRGVLITATVVAVICGWAVCVITNTSSSPSLTLKVL